MMVEIRDRCLDMTNVQLHSDTQRIRNTHGGLELAKKKGPNFEKGGLNFNDHEKGKEGKKLLLVSIR